MWTASSSAFDGFWTETTMWELYALSIFDELKTRANLKRLSEFELDILYARAKTKLWGKIERLRDVPDLHVADFGTRRRHSFLWQEYVVEAMASNLGASFTGTSNAFLAHKHDLEAIGTNAHEIPMVLAAIAPTTLRSKPRSTACWNSGRNVRRGVAHHVARHVRHDPVFEERSGLDR